MTIFKTSDGLFINLDRMLLCSEHPEGKGLLIHESGVQGVRCVHVADLRDASDLRTILDAAAADLREEFGVTLMGKRLLK